MFKENKNILLILFGILLIIFSSKAISQQENVIDNALKSAAERNRLSREESQKNVIEVQRKMFINQGLSEEQIFLNNFKDELYELNKSQSHKVLIESGIKNSQALKYIKDFSSELFQCQKKYWEMMPEILRKHSITLSKNGITPLTAISMAQEDYKKRIILSGKTEEFYTEQIKIWGKEHSLCVKSINIKIENYSQ